MQFYQSIHQYYNDIFPLNQNQIRFVQKEIVENGIILDIGCATGELAKKLAGKNFRVNAFDLNSDMIDIAKESSNSINPTFQTGNMLNINKDYETNRFDGILCFGNTLVHLTDKNQISEFFNSVCKSLKKGGKFLLQVINYQSILVKEHFSLPIIDNEKIKFVREYDFLRNGLINFKTELTIKASNQQINNEIELLPITRDEITELLKHQQFRNIEVFGNFEKKDLMDDSIPLVITAQK